jgi:integrase
MSINALLRYLGRPERVQCPKAMRPPPRYVTHAELQKLLKALPSDECRLVVRVAFGTGARLGEIFALRRRALRNSVRVESQMLLDGSVAGTKNFKARTATVIPTEAKATWQWLEVDEATRKRLRQLDWARLVARAAEAALGRKLVFHDLRHSYAIYWVRLGTPMEAVADCLGNGIGVTDRYYVDHQLTSDVEEAMLKRAKKR